LSKCLSFAAVAFAPPFVWHFAQYVSKTGLAFANAFASAATSCSFDGAGSAAAYTLATSTSAITPARIITGRR